MNPINSQSKSFITRNPHLFPQQPLPNGTGVDEESKLHVKVEEYCRNRRWAFCHARMDRPTTTNTGVADFIIFAPRGITLIVELKKHDGKMSTDQLGFKLMCENNGHNFHIVRSMVEFENLVNEMMVKP